MPILNENQNRKKNNSFIDFIPAELRVNKDWIIVYYLKNPISNKLERNRIRVPKIKNNQERLKFAKRMVLEINDKLLNDWTSFFSESGSNFKSWEIAIQEFENNLLKLEKDNSLRFDSIRTYKSNLNLLKQFISEKKIKITFALEFNKSLCNQYLDWVYVDRGNSPRTRNNHLIFLKLLGNYFVQRGILAENPTNGIKNLIKTPKKRIYIPNDIRNEILKDAISYNDGFYCLCLTIYYCLIRNTELRKIKVKHVDLLNDCINIPKDLSKNKKDETITIPANLKSILQNHIGNCSPEFYLFSNKNFNPDTEQMKIKKINDRWKKMQTRLQFKKEYHFYALKDSGITDLFLAGLPAIKIRDQARHSSVQITELYTPRNLGSDEMIKNAGVNF